MKTLVKINAVTSEITMSKSVATRASSINTDEYNQLLQATRDFPNFKVRVLSPKTRENKHKGLTMELMERLIWAMTNDSMKAIEGFEEVKKCYEGTNFHFSKLKAYFVSQYPNWREWLPQVEQTETETEIPPQEISVERNGIFHRKSV